MLLLSTYGRVARYLQGVHKFLFQVGFDQCAQVLLLTMVADGQPA
jgi:hypothetical protein